MSNILCLFFLLLGIRGLDFEHITVNDLKFPIDLYLDIAIFNQKMSYSHCLGAFDETNLTYFEILNKINAVVKSNKKLYCPVCRIEYPVGDSATDCFGIDYNKPFDSSICLDDLYLSVSYRLPSECIFCGGIFSKIEFDIDVRDGLWETWRPWYQTIRERHDVWEMYAALLEENKIENDFGIAYVYLKASRTYINDNERRRNYLEKCLAYLDKYIEKRKNIDNLENYNNSEKAYLIIKKIDVLRQLGRFIEAYSLIKMLRTDKNISYSYNEVILEQIEALIASKNVMPAVKTFGNKLHMAIHSNLEINNDIVNLINDRSKWQINKWGFSPIGQAIIEERIEYVKLLSESKYKIFEGFDEYRANDLRCLIKRINNPEISEIIETALASQMSSK